MEPKKNPAYDVHRKRALLLNVSFAISLVIVITAFHWTTPVKNRKVPENSTAEPVDMYYPPVSEYKKPEEKTTEKTSRNPTVMPLQFVEVKEIVEALQPDAPLDVEKPIDEPVFSGVSAEPEPRPDSIFLVVEKMPEPKGGYKSFYKTVGTNIKYPALARRTDTEGRVYVQFTVNETGALEDIRVLTGIGNGCDEEAKRVIGLTRWEAGKQRGRAVKVRMVLPVTFTLQK